MVAWYEGVSERLRREAEDEERQREIEAEQAEVRRLQYRKRDDVNDDESVDSRKSALAYFRDPLYRQDGRPTIVRRNSGKRPMLSPRRSSMKDKAKEGATTVGHVIRNIGSPHLWDGRGSSKNDSRDRSRDRRRRSSLPENRSRHSSEPQTGQESRTSSYTSSHSQHRRDRSGQPTPRQDVSGPEEGWNADDEDTPINSRSESHSRQRHYPDDDQTLRHSRSAEPTPSQKEITDYFYNFEDASNSRSSSKNVTPNGVGPSFGPSASPLFASHIAKQPQPQMPRQPHPQADYGPSRSSRHSGPAPDRRPYSRSPHPSDRPRDRDDGHHNRSQDRDDRHYHSHSHSHSHSRDGDRHRSRDRPQHYNDAPTSAPMPAPQPRYPPIGGDPNIRPPPQGGSPYPPQGGAPLPTRDRRRSGRMSGSDLSYSGGEDVRRGSIPSGPPPMDDGRRGSAAGGPGGGPGGPKQTRFASVSGVDGRRYPNESPWR